MLLPLFPFLFLFLPPVYFGDLLGFGLKLRCPLLRCLGLTPCGLGDFALAFDFLLLARLFSRGFLRQFGVPVDLRHALGVDIQIPQVCDVVVVATVGQQEVSLVGFECRKLFASLFLLHQLVDPFVDHGVEFLVGQRRGAGLGRATCGQPEKGVTLLRVLQSGCNARGALPVLLPLLGVE